ncbi:MAG: hypothetical protein H6555_04660 [Lewinellaceae bacterium]|nr:hypothetical protein [Lewinellaceae bacterium]
MQKSLLLAILFFLSGSYCLITSCEKSESELASISVASFEEIGLKHNIALRHILAKTIQKPRSEEMESWVMNQLSEMLPLEYQVYQQNKGEIDPTLSQALAYGTPFDHTTLIQHLQVSAALKGFLLQMSDLILADLEIPAFERELVALQDQASAQLNQEELVILYASASVAKYSTRFWYPKSRGGESGMDYLPENLRNGSLRGILWGKVILSDAVGTVAGAVGALATSGGAAAIPNPLTGGIPPAGIAGLIGGAASSISTIIGEL